MRYLKIIISEFGKYIDFILIWFPGSLGNLLRYLIYRRRFATCGRSVRIPTGVVFKGFSNIKLGDNVNFGYFNQIFSGDNEDGARIEIGDNVSCNSNVMINADCNGEIIIEKNVLIAPNVVIRASNHKFERSDIPIREQGHSGGKIVVREDSWIGANVVVLPDVTIGKGAVIGAGAVVTKDVNDFEIACGVPAKKIGARGRR